MTQLSSEKPELFKGRHFNHLLIIQAVRLYVTYKLSYRDVCDLMAERGVTVVHTTIIECRGRLARSNARPGQQVLE
jgi:transposase-like protein